MKKQLIALALLGSTMASQAVPTMFSGMLSGTNEVPSNASGGSGSATVTFDPDANTLHVQVTFAGLTQAAEASHIHCCTAPGSNAMVATTVPSFPGFPAATSGSYDEIFNTSLASSFNPAFVSGPGGGSVGGAESALFDAMVAGNTYLNIHNDMFPGGEVRGQLATAAAAIPEPSTYALLGAGLLAIAAAARRRRAG